MRQIPITRPNPRRFPCGEPMGLLAAILRAARHTGIQVPAELLNYDAARYPHWDFLVRYAQRRTLCTCIGSWEQRLDDAETTARVYMDQVMLREIGAIAV